VYENKTAALNNVLKHKTVLNKSLVRPSSACGDEWMIEMLHIVGKERGPFVFSDHSGFVSKYTAGKNDGLYVYYHSLEHGEQHTITGTARYFGSLPEQKIATFKKDKNGKIGELSRSIHNPRRHYVECLKDETEYLVGGKEKGLEILVVIGECTQSIYNEVIEELDFLTDLGYARKYINACKSSKKNENQDGGPGVNALIGIHVYPKSMSNTNWEIKAYMIKKEGEWEQNFLGVHHRDYGTKHALAHLLNGKEDDIAIGLHDNGYVSVGGDLNKINAEEELIATCNREGSRIYIGSNSSATKWYDKIVILSKEWAEARAAAKEKKKRKRKNYPGKGVNNKNKKKRM